MNYIPRYKVTLVREGSMKADQYPKFTGSAMAADWFRAEVVDADRERFYTVTLDTKNRLIGVNLVSLGSLASSIVHPREVFKVAVMQGAAAIICFHNHPSGDPTPGKDDRECTERLQKAARILGIRLLDHIIVGEGDYFSFADAGIVDPGEVQ